MLNLLKVEKKLSILKRSKHILKCVKCATCTNCPSVQLHFSLIKNSPLAILQYQFLMTKTFSCINLFTSQDYLHLTEEEI